MKRFFESLRPVFSPPMLIITILSVVALSIPLRAQDDSGSASIEAEVNPESISSFRSRHYKMRQKKLRLTSALSAALAELVSRCSIASNSFSLAPRRRISSLCSSLRR